MNIIATAKEGSKAEMENYNADDYWNENNADYNGEM